MNAAANDLKPAPDNLTGHTGKAFTSAQLITMACHGVLNTTFTEPKSKPTWFDDLNADLKTAQAVAEEWIKELAPDVTSSIPNQVIHFQSTFDQIAKQIIAIAEAHPNAKGKDDPNVTQIRELIAQALIPTLDDVITEIDASDKKLGNWGTKLQSAHNALSSKAGDIQNAETNLKTDIEKMNNAITTLNNSIDAENKAIAASAAAIGIGFFALIVGIALAPETGGASLVIGGAIGAAGIIGGSVAWGFMRHKINEQFGEIAADQKEKNDDERRLIALQGLALASNGAVSNLALASNALSMFRTSFVGLGKELKAIVEDLDIAEKGLAVIVQKSMTEAAVTTWGDAAKTAQSLLDRKIEIDSKTLPMSDSKAA